MTTQGHFDNGILKASIDEAGQVHLDLSKLPVATGPLVAIPVSTVAQFMLWFQAQVGVAQAVPGKKPRDLEDIKKFIDDLQKQLPKVIAQIRGVFPHPFDKSMETALAPILRNMVEEIITEEPTLREKLKELVKNLLDDAVTKDEKWNEGEEQT